MNTGRYRVTWLGIMRLLRQALTSPSGWITLLSTIVMIGGCDREVIIVDDTPAQFIEADNDGRHWEVYFDKQPNGLSVEGAKEYGLSGKKLWITGEGSRRGEIIVSWQGGKRTLTYPPPRRDYDVLPPPATTVTVHPPPGAIIPSNQEFSLIFDQGIQAATVNGFDAIGAGPHWTIALALQQGRGHYLNVMWENRDGSTGSMAVGPYTVRDE